MCVCVYYKGCVSFGHHSLVFPHMLERTSAVNMRDSYMTVIGLIPARGLVGQVQGAPALDNSFAYAA